MKVNVVLFKPSGKYYTEEPWEVPDRALIPYEMIRSPDFRRIDGGAVLIETQEPWGFPHLFPGGGRPVSLRDEFEKTLRINLAHGPDTYAQYDNAFITNTVDDLMADLTIHGLIKE